MTSGINIKQILTYFFLNSNKCSSIICSSFPFCHFFFFIILDFNQKELLPPQKKTKKKKNKRSYPKTFMIFIVLDFYSAIREALLSFFQSTNYAVTGLYCILSHFLKMILFVLFSKSV